MAYFLPKAKNKPEQSELCSDVVEMTGFEPAASASRTQRSTKLSHISLSIYFFNI
jgi:hypothetical protein